MEQTIIRAQAGGRFDLAGPWGDGCTLIDPKNDSHVLGRVTNVGLKIGATVEIRPITEKGVRVICNGFDEILDENSDYADYNHGLDLFVAATRRFKDILAGEHGWQIRAHSDIPHKSGLGGSAAMAVPLVACVLYALDLKEKYPQLEMEDGKLTYVNRAFIASEARALEIEQIQISSGWQDQWAAAFGGVSFIRAESDPQKPVHWHVLSDPGRIKELQNYLMLVHTPRDEKTKRSSDDQHKKVGAIGRFDLLRQIACQGIDARDAIKASNFLRLGKIVDEVWKTTKEFSDGIVESEEINWLIDEVKHLGAWGAKACGAGGPGACVGIIANQATQELIKQKLVDFPDFTILPVEISQTGLVVERVH